MQVGPVAIRVQIGLDPARRMPRDGLNFPNLAISVVVAERNSRLAVVGRLSCADNVKCFGHATACSVLLFSGSTQC